MEENGDNVVKIHTSLRTVPLSMPSIFTKLTTVLWHYVEIPYTQFQQNRSRKRESMNINPLHDYRLSDFQETHICSTHPCKELHQIS
jgi:hypothetical protein